MSVQAGGNAAVRMGATVGGYGAIGMFIESIVVHRHPWFQPGVVTAAATTALAVAQSFVLGFLRAKKIKLEEDLAE